VRVADGGELAGKLVRVGARLRDPGVDAVPDRGEARAERRRERGELDVELRGRVKVARRNSSSWKSRSWAVA
jgi:hypothetical protein